MSEFPENRLRGKKRREVEAPPVLPHLDREGLRKLSEFRTRTYRQPILDDLLGYYRFDPPTKKGAELYTGARTAVTGQLGMARDIVQRYVKLPESVEDARLRQVLHRAESTELATALFWSVAVMRQTVVDNAIESISRREDISDEVSVYAADAIIDMGLCLESPYEPNWRLKADRRRKASPQGLRDRLDRISPDLGVNVAEFGAYASKNPEVLHSPDGLTALLTVREEQDYRMDTWGPRHTAITEAFPDLPLSREILYMQLPLSEMLSIQDNLEN